MTSNEKIVEIVVCLGSSCFARGNADNLTMLNQHVLNNGLKATVRLTGRLCQDECKQGPNLMIDGVLHHGVSMARLRELLQEPNSPLRSDHGTA